MLNSKRALVGLRMACGSCGSENETEFTAEIMIHFSGRRHPENPGVFVLSKMSVCLDCGSTRFTISETELRLLRDGIGPTAAA